MPPKKSEVEFAGKSCEACGKVAGVNTSLRRCHGCQGALYCSRDCQKGDWKMHKHMCRDKQVMVPIETRTLGVVKVGPVMTVARFNAAKPGDPPPKDEDRVLLYDASPEQIHDQCTALLEEYKESIRERVSETKAASAEPSSNAKK